MATPPLTILGLSGSLRKGSLNTALLQAAKTLAPADVLLQIHPIGNLPLYNSDLEDPAELAPTKALGEAIAAADGVLIATPEYNYGIPGVLKNALDWASRPAYRSVFAHKPVAVVSASMSFVGGARAQAHLRQVLTGMVSRVFPTPEFLVGGAHKKFDQEGNLTDASTGEHLQALVGRFADWIRLVGAN